MINKRSLKELCKCYDILYNVLNNHYKYGMNSQEDYNFLNKQMEELEQVAKEHGFKFGLTKNPNKFNLEVLK